MAKIFNAQDVVFEERPSRLPEFLWRTSPQLAELCKAKHFHFDFRSLEPGKFSFPYHYHWAAEELFVILQGEATLRSPEGFQKVRPGDVIFFEEGSDGAHQLYNHGDSSCVYLDLRTTMGVDVCEYPDSGKVGVFPKRAYYDAAATQDYYAGEERVAEKWPEAVLRKK